REYKFDVPVDLEPPALDTLVGQVQILPRQGLKTTYFDTPDLRLWADGITLRHRTIADDGRPGKWTLKRPAGSPGRGEMARTESSWSGPGDHIPSGAVDAVAGLLGGAPLQPVVVLESERSRMLLVDVAGGEPWGEVDDDLVTVASGARAGTRFRQLELELLGAGSPAVAAVVAAWTAAGAVPGGGSKFALAAGVS
ncbi:MAG TPA: CYTH domain-containing protein, partial [Acidimicrobiales bacterium]|nr:CYTH domain-containing protein [Acidimicrobiales bacterium]